MFTRKLSNEKALRIGVVEKGRIIEERIFRGKRPVTVGQRPDNSIMVTSPQAPESWRLLAVKSGRYVLRFSKGMVGKVALGDQLLDLKTLARKRLAQRRNNEFFFPLPEGSRGKVLMGGSTLLFQFVNPPAAVARFQLPLELKAAFWRSLDKALLSTFVLAFLMMGGSGASLDAWWRTTGRYLAPTLRSNSSLLDSLPVTRARVEPAPVAEAPGGKVEAEALVEEPSGHKDFDRPAIAEGDRVLEETPRSTEDSLARALAQMKFPEADTEFAPEAAKVREAVKEGMRVSVVSTRPTAPRNPTDARTYVGETTVVGLVGSEFGRGPAAAGNPFGDVVRRNKNQDAFGQGTWMIAGEAAGGSVLEEAAANAESAPLSGHDAVDAARRLQETAREIGRKPAPDLGKITAKAGKLKGKAKRREKKVLKLVGLTRPTGPMPTGKRNEFNEFLKVKSAALGRCYLMEARKNAAVAGKLELRIRVDMTGKARVKILVNKTGSKKVESCVRNRLQGWQFPLPAGKPVEFVVPILFRTQ
jgi:hypothetical protein